MTLPKDTDYYTVAEVAAHLRISTMSVYRYIKAGQIPSVRLGGSVRVPAAGLAALENSALASVPDDHDTQRPAEEL